MIPSTMFLSIYEVSIIFLERKPKSSKKMKLKPIHNTTRALNILLYEPINKNKGVIYMFTIRRKFEVECHEVMDFVRLLGRFGLKFKVSDEYVAEHLEDRTMNRFRRFVVFGTRRQLSDFLEAREIICDYHLH